MRTTVAALVVLALFAVALAALSLHAGEGYEVRAQEALKAASAQPNGSAPTPEQTGGLSCEVFLTFALDNTGAAQGNPLTRQDADDLQGVAQIIHDGDPAASRNLDEDGDGVACEQFEEEPLEAQVAFSLSCEVFDTPPASIPGEGGRDLAQGLYDGDPDLYAGFDRDGNGVACEELAVRGDPPPGDDPKSPPPVNPPGGSLMKAGGPMDGPVPPLPGGGCPREFPYGRGGACHGR